MGVERRDYPRIAVTWRAKVIVPKRGILRGVVKDAAPGGAYLEIECAMPIKQTFLMEFYPFIGSQMYSVRVRGECTYDTVLSDDRGHGLGVRFVEIAESDKGVIKRALR